MDAPVIGPPKSASGPADRDRGGLTDRPRVGGDGHDHEHEEEREHELPEERLSLRAARKRRAVVGVVAEGGAEQRGREQRPGELGTPVGHGTRPREMPGQREREGDGGIEVRSGDVPDRVDHHHDHEPEAEGHAEVAERAGLCVDDDRSATGEDEREGPYRLGYQGARERRRVSHSEAARRSGAGRARRSRPGSGEPPRHPHRPGRRAPSPRTSCRGRSDTHRRSPS